MVLGTLPSYGRQVLSELSSSPVSCQQATFMSFT